MGSAAGEGSGSGISQRYRIIRSGERAIETNSRQNIAHHAVQRRRTSSGRSARNHHPRTNQKAVKISGKTRYANGNPTMKGHRGAPSATDGIVHAMEAA